MPNNARQCPTMYIAQQCPTMPIRSIPVANVSNFSSDALTGDQKKLAVEIVKPSKDNEDVASEQGGAAKV